MIVVSTVQPVKFEHPASMASASLVNDATSS